MNIKVADMPLKDKLSLGPIRKYQVYDKFPWKFTLHITLIILTTMQILWVVKGIDHFTRNNNFFYFQEFMNADTVPTQDDYNRDVIIFSIDDLDDFVNLAIDNYYNLTNQD